MVARCAHADAGGFRLWPIFSAGALRRKVLEVLTCGGGGGVAGDGGGGSCRGRTAYRSPQRMPRPQPRPRSDRLAELLRAEEQSECGGDDADEAEAGAAAARKVEALEELKGVVGALQAGGDEACMSRVEAAMAVRRKAKDDTAAREMLAMLGAIPPLVSMLDEDGDDGEEVTAAALYALLNLGIGNDTNKAAIVQAGAVHKMLRIAEAGGGASSAALTEAVVANFLCLSALDANKLVIGASGAAPFLVRAFQGAATEQARHDALRALLNLSIAAANAPHLLAAGLVPALVAAVGDGDDATVADRALAALCNLVAACPEGRRAVSRAPDTVPCLVDVLNWADEPGCQEKAAYVLMVLAHRSYGDRAAMAEAGATSALLELTLVGTALAQKRASRILEILRADKGKQVAGDDDATGGVVAAVSAPQERGCRGGEEEAVDGEPVDACMSAEKRAVRQLVQQSLQSNMRRIVRRARLPQDLAPASAESLKALTASSTSKSLPF